MNEITREEAASELKSTINNLEELMKEQMEFAESSIQTMVADFERIGVTRKAISRLLIDEGINVGKRDPFADTNQFIQQKADELCGD